MSVLVYVENASGKFKKSTFETVSYARSIADAAGLKTIAISIGNVSGDEMKGLGKFGASKVLNVADAKFATYNNQAFASAIAEAASKEQAQVVVIPNTFSGKGIAPRVAVKLKAGFVDAAVSLPDNSNGFVVRTSAYSGKAFADVKINSAVKVISISANSYKIIENETECSVEDFNPATNDGDFKLIVKDTVRATDKVSLPEAELVVSGGRGLKGPENWGMVEELAGLLGAATACSKPVSDAHWRPHSEHVGQTGIAVSPNLYLAIGISGAIQHLAGVSASKTIVVINKDPEAPFFKAADYGIVGDAFEVVPRLIESVKKYKASHN